MPGRRPPLLIVGGQVWATTGRTAEELASASSGGPAADVVVWDEADVDHRWDGHPAAFVVRDRPLAHRHPRAGTAELRAHLWRRRHADVAMVGHAALGAAPWLARHRGRRVWLVTVDDLAALGDGLAIPPAAEGGPHHVVTTDLEVARSERLRTEPRHRWAPGFWPAAPSEPARAEVLAWGPPDRRQGVDLVGRALAARADGLRAAGARVRWLAPPGAQVPAEEADDLRRAGVDDLLAVETVADPEAALRTALPGAAALLVCGRPGAWTAEDETLIRAFRHGVRVAGFGPPPPDDLALGRRWSLEPFADVTALATAIAAAVRAPASDRRTGPIGVAALVRDLDAGASRA